MMRSAIAATLIGLLLTACAAGAQELAPAGSSAEGAPLQGRYKLSGARELRPVRIDDDGVHTYIVWSEDQALPAVFAISPTGTEEMVDGYMRSGIFTIDRVHRTLVFRIDKKVTKAERIGS